MTGSLGGHKHILYLCDIFIILLAIFSLRKLVTLLNR